MDRYFDSGLNSADYLHVVARLSAGDFDHPDVRLYSGVDISPLTDDSTTFRLCCAKTGAVDCRVMGAYGLSGPRLDPVVGATALNTRSTAGIHRRVPIDPATLDTFEFFEWLDRATVDELLAFGGMKFH